MAREDLVIRIAGEAGEGVLITGQMVTQATARAGYYVLTDSVPPAEIKGGYSFYQIRLGEQRLRAAEVERTLPARREHEILHAAQLAIDRLAPKEGPVLAGKRPPEPRWAVLPPELGEIGPIELPEALDDRSILSRHRPNGDHRCHHCDARPQLWWRAAPG